MQFAPGRRCDRGRAGSASARKPPKSENADETMKEGVAGRVDHELVPPSVLCPCDVAEHTVGSRPDEPRQRMLVPGIFSSVPQQRNKRDHRAGVRAEQERKNKGVPGRFIDNRTLCTPPNPDVGGGEQEVDGEGGPIHPVLRHTDFAAPEADESDAQAQDGADDRQDQQIPAGTPVPFEHRQRGCSVGEHQPGRRVGLDFLAKRLLDVDQIPQGLKEAREYCRDQERHPRSSLKDRGGLPLL